MDDLKTFNSMKTAQDHVKSKKSQVFERRGVTEAIDNNESKCGGILISLILMQAKYQCKSA